MAPPCKKLRNTFAPAWTKPGQALSWKYSCLINCSLCLYSSTEAFLTFLLKHARARISGIAEWCAAGNDLPGTAMTLERHRYWGPALDMSTTNLVCCQLLVPHTYLVVNRQCEYAVVAFGKRSGYKLAPRLLLIMFFHELCSLGLLSCFKIWGRFLPDRKMIGGGGWRREACELVVENFFTFSPSLCNVSPDTNVAARNKDRWSPSCSHWRFPCLPGQAELCPSLPALEGRAAPGQGCGDVRSIPTEVEPKAGNTTRGCFSPRAAEIATWSGLSYKLSALLCMNKCSV